MERLSELPVSTTVGDAYRLVRRVGDGAQGAVFEARMPFDGDRRCALKLMNGALTDSAAALAAFQSQAEIASRITHPHLVRVFDFGSDPTGQCFLVMEFLEGEDLARRLARAGRFAPPAVSSIIAQIALALAAVHEQGFAHLDLKPSNVFLQPREGNRDFVKLLDFATARIENARTVNHPTALEDTLPYVAPEQASGRTEPLDHRTDQWALACIAWQMLFGRTPFAGPHATDATSLLYQIVYEDPSSVNDVAGGVPAGVMTVLRRALEKRPDDRFEDIAGFVKAFEAMAGTLPPLAELPEAAPRPQGRVQPGAEPGSVMPRAGASGPVFLPGMSPRPQEPPRRSARRTRLQGLRVSTAGPATGIPPLPAHALVNPRVKVVPPNRSEAPPSTSPWPLAAPLGHRPLSAMANEVVDAAKGRWKWMVGTALPVLLIGGLLVGRGKPAEQKAIDVDRGGRAPAAPLGEAPSDPAAPAPTWPAGQGPEIQPLNAAAATSTTLKKARRRRQRGQGLRAKVATPGRVDGAPRHPARAH